MSSPRLPLLPAGSITPMSKTTLLLVLYIVSGLLQLGAAIIGTVQFKDNRDGTATVRNLTWATVALASGTFLSTIASVYWLL